LYLRLEPLSWRQEIRNYPTINVVGRYLAAKCKAAADSNLRLSKDINLADLTVELSILEGEPEDARSKRLERGIGDVCFKEMPPNDYDSGIDPFISVCFYFKSESYTAVWDQVRNGGYGSCEITISVDEVKSEGFGWLWDVSQPLTISSAAINFTRKPIADKPAGEAPPRRGFFTWLNPSAAAEAEVDADVAELLNRDVEKRRRNAWLRQIGFVGRIAVYACLFGALFIFRPQGASDVTTKPVAQLAIGDIMAAVVWVIIGLLLLRALFKPNPRPDYQEAWGRLSVVLIIGALVLGALFLYLRA
jgi:hypothetical protein